MNLPWSLLSGTENHKVVKLIERLHNINNQPYAIDHHHIEIKASIGVAYYPLDGIDADALVKMADMRMYQQKKLTGLLSLINVCKFPDPASKGRYG
ncbi:MAG: diguanylate cyclase [Thiolinea sp.]